MKYLLLLLIIALPFLLLLNYTHDVAEEVSSLKARVELQGEEIRANRDYIGYLEEELGRIERAGEERYMPWSHIIPIHKGFLGVLEEKK